jgi:hypothetical protein
LIRTFIWQWVGIMLLMLGMMVIAAEKMALGEKALLPLVKGTMVLLLLETASACAGIYTELLLKTLYAIFLMTNEKYL